VDEEARPLHVAEELLAEARAVACALDQTGDVRDDELPIVEPRDSEVRDKRREGIVGDLRTRAGERGEERGFSRVRHSGEPDIGQELELEVDLAALALPAVFRDPRRSPRARGEARVAFAAGPAARDDELRARCDAIRDRLTRRPIDHERARGHGEDAVRTRTPGAVSAGTVLATLSAGLAGEAEIGERAELWIDAQHDIAAFAAITSIGSAAGHMRFAAERDHAAAAVAPLHDQPRAIEEHR